MTKIELLKAARELIQSGEQRVICLALYSVGKSEGVTEYLYLRRWVEEMLGTYNTLDSWLFREHGMPLNNSKKLKEPRLAWIDWMIKELEK